MRIVGVIAVLLSLAGALPGVAADRPQMPKKSIHILDLLSPALSITPRIGSCTRESEVARADRPGADRVRCTRALIVRHSQVDGRDTTIVFWDPEHVERSLSVAGKLDGDHVNVRAVQPDNGGVAYPASGICRLQIGMSDTPAEPDLFGSDPFDNVDSLVCTADRDGKRILHVAFASQAQPASKPIP